MTQRHPLENGALAMEMITMVAGAHAPRQQRAKHIRERSHREHEERRENYR
jgi:hypothetical protein